MSLKYEPASEPLHIYAKKLFLNRELYRSVQPTSFPHARAFEGRPNLVLGAVTSFLGPFV